MPWQCSLSFVPIELEHYFGFIYSRKANLFFLIMAIILAPRQEFISLEDSAFRSFLSKGFFSIRTIVASDPMFSKCVRWSTEEASANEGRCHLWNKRVWGYMKLISLKLNITQTLWKSAHLMKLNAGPLAPHGQGPGFNPQQRRKTDTFFPWNLTTDPVFTESWKVPPEIKGQVQKDLLAGLQEGEVTTHASLVVPCTSVARLRRPCSLQKHHQLLVSFDAFTGQQSRRVF